MKKANILYVVENAFFGGGEQAFAQLINGLDKSRYTIFAACLTGDINSASAVFEEMIKNSANVVSFDLRKRVNLRNLFLLKKIIHNNDIAIIHSQGARADFYARLAARLAGKIAIVSTVAAPVEEYNVRALRKMVYRAFDRFGERWVDKFIPVAGHLERKLIQERHLPAQKVARIYNGVNVEKRTVSPDEYAKTRHALNIGPESFLVGVFSRFSAEKGLDCLIEAARIIMEMEKPADSAIRYLVAGAGELEKELKLKVNTLGLKEKFIFTGFMNDIGPALSVVNVVVLPSLREGFPMILLEAMAAGKPVVASDIDGVRESVIDGINGFLVPPGDSAALAGAIVDLMRNREKAVEMGAHGRSAVLEKFSLGRMLKEHESSYEAVLPDAPDKHSDFPRG